MRTVDKHSILNHRSQQEYKSYMLTIQVEHKRVQQDTTYDVKSIGGGGIVRHLIKQECLLFTCIETIKIII